MKRALGILLVLMLLVGMFAACGTPAEVETPAEKPAEKVEEAPAEVV